MFNTNSTHFQKEEPKIPVSRGFTLMEAVIALAILSIGIFVIIETTARCLAVIRSSRNYQTARAVLDQGEAEFPLQSTNAVEDNQVSETEYESGYSFARELQEVNGEKKLYVVKTRVTWSESGQGAVEEVVSYLYFPNEE
ncbi:MAG: prepilin-type N-terminal cleavage/methylation domain-containing protein [Lentisphaerae bacterium]|nr:prepilin-type N-terminal cleavage/methylation domain-containing protein [Lentisphaerota bacterium]